MKVRSTVLKALEEARDAKLIGKSFEARVNLYVDASVQELITRLGVDVRQTMIVSQLEMHALDEAPADALQGEGVVVVVEHAAGEVCPRCRMYREDLGTDSELAPLCGRCAAVVRQDFPEAVTEGLEK